MTIAQHFWISGRVQGVYFRASTRAKALELGLDGWVRNLPDGRVEVLASGEPDGLAQFERWLWQGPERAQVADVQGQAKAPPDVRGFELR